VGQDLPLRNLVLVLFESRLINRVVDRPVHLMGLLDRFELPSFSCLLLGATQDRFVFLVQSGKFDTVQCLIHSSRGLTPRNFLYWHMLVESTLGCIEVYVMGVL
jgi:hypothetical protein